MQEEKIAAVSNESVQRRKVKDCAVITLCIGRRELIANGRRTSILKISLPCSTAWDQLAGDARRSNISF